MGIIKRFEQANTPTISLGSPQRGNPEARWFAQFREGSNLTRPDAATGPAGERTLRCHRSMTYRGLANWPPVWTARGRNIAAGDEAFPHRPTLRGEIGTLKQIFLSTAPGPPRIYLIIAHEGSEYIGALLFDNVVFCRQIYQLLKESSGKTIAEIGSLSVSHLD